VAEDSPPPSEDQQSRGRSLNPGRSQQINRVEVTRMDVQTGEIKELQTDLLSEICDCIDEQTVTLGKKLDQLQREIVKGLERQRKDKAKGGGSDAKAQKAAIAALKKWTDEVDASTQATDENTDSKKKAKKETEKLSKEMGGLRGRTVALFAIAKTAWEGFTENLDLAKTGLFDLSDSIKDIGALQLEGRLSTVESMKIMQRAIERGAAPAIGALGSDMQEVGFELANFQERVREFGFDFETAMDFREMAVAQAQLVDLQRRASIQGSIRDAQTDKNAANQLSFLKDISAFSGKTLDALLDAHAADLLNLAELRAVGAINEQQEKTFGALIPLFAQTGAKPIADLITQVLNAGSFELAVQEDPSLQILANQAPEIARIFNEVRNSQDFANQLESDREGALLTIADKLTTAIKKAPGLSPEARAKIEGASGTKLGGLIGAARAAKTTEEMAAILASIDQGIKDDPVGTQMDEFIQLTHRAWENNVPRTLQLGFASVVTMLGSILDFLKWGFAAMGFGKAGKALMAAKAAKSALPGAAAAAGTGGGIFAGLKSFGAKALGGAKSMAGKALKFGAKRIVAPISAGLAGVELGKWLEDEFGFGSMIGRLPELVGLDESIGTGIFELEQWIRKGIGAGEGAGITSALEKSRELFGNLYESIGLYTGAERQIDPQTGKPVAVGPPSAKASKPLSEQSAEEMVSGLLKVASGTEETNRLLVESNRINEGAAKALEAGDKGTFIAEMTKHYASKGMTLTPEMGSKLFSEATGVGS